MNFEKVIAILIELLAEQESVKINYTLETRETEEKTA